MQNLRPITTLKIEITKTAKECKCYSTGQSQQKGNQRLAQE